MNELYAFVRETAQNSSHRDDVRRLRWRKDLTPTTALEFEEVLGEMVATIRGHRGSLLITSHKPLPVGLRHALGLSANQIIAVPQLSREEVAEIATGIVSFLYLSR